MSMVRKINRIAYALILAGLCMGLAGVVSADAASVDTIAEGKAAEKAGRYEEALKHYVTALESMTESSLTEQLNALLMWDPFSEEPLKEGNTSERRVREKIIAIALKMKPPPKIPDAVIEHEGRAEAAVQMAKKPEDFLLAAREYREATRLAPWVARYYFNLGVVLEKSGRLAEAVQNYELYLLAAPGAPDQREVGKRVAGLKFKQEVASKEGEEESMKQAAEAERRTRETNEQQEAERLVASLAGQWHNSCAEPGTIPGNPYALVSVAPLKLDWKAWDFMDREWIEHGRHQGPFIYDPSAKKLIMNNRSVPGQRREVAIINSNRLEETLYQPNGNTSRCTWTRIP